MDKQEPVVWFIQYSDSHEFSWAKPESWQIELALEITPLYAAPVDAGNMPGGAR